MGRIQVGISFFCCEVDGKGLCANYVARKLQDHLNCLKLKSQLRSSILCCSKSVDSSVCKSE